MTPNDQQLTVSPDEVGLTVSESEHAFIDMMKFYVPGQLASGGTDPSDQVDLGNYYNIDEAWVEYLPVAKPLVSVFIHGPAIGVGDLPFAHSFMDAYAAVSLDDGLTWKTTNLSLSADQSSFVLGVDRDGDGGDDDELPADHNQLEKDGDLMAFHARGMEYPYANECTECHGTTLEGGHHGEPTCYSCHGPVWKEDAPDGVLVVYIDEATAREDGQKVKVKVDGAVEGAASKATATLINGVTEALLDTTRVEDNGKFHFEFEHEGLAPCTVVVIVEGVKSRAFTVVDKKTDEPLETCDGEPHDFTIYPGGVHNIFHATAGNKVLVAWPSRYCEQGKPAYSLGNSDETELTRVVEFIQTGQAADGNNTLALPGFNLEDDLYLVDAFGVAGSQKSSDFADEGYPDVGEVPYGCVWTARGVMLPGDDPRTTDVTEMSHMVWTKAERLTSGRRDPFRIEVKAVLDKDGPYEGGFVITWQEDPDGLRPGQGLGPGEGWSGAVAHSKTDIWYSFINMEYFDYVLNETDGVPINIATHDLLDSGRPKVFVPMAIPMRLTNNDKCKVDELSGELVDTSLYCHYEEYDFGEEGDPNLMAAADYGVKDQCMDTVLVPTGPNDDPKPICVSEDRLPNLANTASTRPRLSVQESDSGSGWVIVAAEESKGLGAFFYYPDGSSCVEDREDPLCQEEIGKNQWYFSFDMGTPDTSADLSETSLVKNLVSQGNMLNQPEVYWETGRFLPLMDSSIMWQFPDYNFQIYNTEIARRSSLLAQSVDKANSGTSGLLAVSSWKQGPMRQGGPADTMMRRFVDQGTSLNPYAFTNMVCDSWDFDDGSNPYYPDGVCLDPATNLSSVTPDTCVDTAATDGGTIACPSVDEFGVGDTNPILQGYIQGEGNTQKVLTWHQCPSAGTPEGDFDAVTCDPDDLTGNLTDQSWYNPLDVSKGHRGFLDGDMVMFMYAWSPNWRLNAKGNDRYDLYVRRSFDGGVTWTTTPGAGTASDGVTPYAGNGTTTCETYRSLETQASGEIPEPQVCYTYPSGGAEQARNVTQHSRMRVTTLDPRYAPTPASIPLDCLDFTDPTIAGAPWTCDDISTSLDSDLRDPSRYFIVYETGDNSTVAVGEAEPLDLYYSRAINFGDDYVVWTDEVVDSTLAECYPSDPHGDEKIIGTPAAESGFCNEFDRMNAGGDTHSSEANLEANPDGSKLYGVWAQWVFDDYGEEVEETDPMARRIWWIDDYISLNPDLVWTLPGTNQPE
jgi:hypothetical protein